MTDKQLRRLQLLWPAVGVLAMLAGLGILLLRHDEGGGLNWLFIGAVIFGTSGIGRRQHRRRPRGGATDAGG